MSKGKLIETTDAPATKCIGTLHLHDVDSMNKKSRAKIATWLRRQAATVEEGNLAKRYRARYHVAVSILAILCLVGAGCVADRGALQAKKPGEQIDIFHEGKDIKQRHVIETEWGKPGDVSYMRCRPDQLKHDDFWGIKTCSGSIDANAPLSIEIGRTVVASYRDLVVPATISGLFQVAAFGTLGAVMPAPKVDVRQNALTGSRFSTGYFNSTPAPAWLGQ